MKKYILIGIFGIGGAIFRFGIGLFFHSVFPWGTLIVNLAGCFLLPVIFIFIQEIGAFSGEIVTAMGTGFVGAFTTFSTFSADIVKLINDEKIIMACIYLFTSLAGGLIVVAISINISNFAVDKFIKKGE